MTAKYSPIIAIILLAAVAGAARGEEKAKPPYWLEPMKKLNAQFKGTDNYIARFGDSITVSRAFWSPLGWSDPDVYLPDDGLPKRPAKPWKQVIGGINDEDGAAGGWTTENVLKVIDKVLADRKPELAIIMIGTNDISGGKAPKGYRERLEKIITKCLDAKCIPILNTIPPRKDHDRAVKEVNGIIQDLAEKHHIPLVDYHDAIMMRQPEGRWLGTLIDKDGVHPTAGKTQDYSSQNLDVSGYALRTWVNFLMVREVYFKVLEPAEAKVGK
jgi:lysophospholipase L1-like esterase